MNSIPANLFVGAAVCGEDPESTPLGWRYTINLESGEETGPSVPVYGGLRLTYYRDENSPACRELLWQARRHGVAIVHVAQGNTFNWDGTQAEISWPTIADAAVQAPEPANNDSAVLRIGDGAIHFLFAGTLNAKLRKPL